jgi:ubiquinone/menaquinone biosynthesis C-methylase UbiE
MNTLFASEYNNHFTTERVTMSKHTPILSDEPAPTTEGLTIHWARNYDLVVKLLTLGQSALLRTRTADLARLTAGEAVLDVGCGTGDLTREVHKRVGSTGLTAGIDAAPEMITHARRKATRERMTLDFRLEPVEGLSFADHTFDVVVSSLVFHHLPSTLKLRGLAEIKRVLKPGGRLVIVDFLRPPHAIFDRTVLRIGLQDMPALLVEAGFIDVEWQRGPFPLLGTLRGHTMLAQ